MKNKIQKLLEKDIQVGDGIEFTSKDSMGTQIVCVVGVNKGPLVLGGDKNIYEIYVMLDGVFFHYPNDASNKLWDSENYSLTHDIKLIKNLYNVNISIE